MKLSKQADTKIDAIISLPPVKHARLPRKQEDADLLKCLIDPAIPDDSERWLMILHSYFRCSEPQDYLKVPLANVPTAIISILKHCAAKDDEAAFVLGVLWLSGGTEQSIQLDGARYILRYDDLKFPIPLELHGRALLMLGKSLCEDSNDPKQQERGFDYLLKAANLPYPPAFYIVGKCYELGGATTRDYVQAYRWLALAAKYENDPGLRFSRKHDLDRFETDHPGDHIGKGQALAGLFKLDDGKGRLTLPEE